MQEAHCTQGGEENIAKNYQFRNQNNEKMSDPQSHWLRMIAVAVPTLRNEARSHWREAQELNLIFSAIIRKKKDIGY